MNDAIDSVSHEADPNADEFKCERCQGVFDIEDSIRHDGNLFCPCCVESVCGVDTQN